MRVHIRQFSEDEVSAAVDCLRSTSPDDLQYYLTPPPDADDLELKKVGVRLIQALARAGFVDDLANGAMLLLSVWQKLDPEWQAYFEKKRETVEPPAKRVDLRRMITATVIYAVCGGLIMALAYMSVRGIRI